MREYLQNLLDVQSNWVLRHVVMEQRMVEFLIHTTSIETFKTNVYSIIEFLIDKL